MRILHIGKFWPPAPGGIEVFCKDLADAQYAVGDEPAVVGHIGRDAPPQADTPYPVELAQVWKQVVYAPIAPRFRSLLKRMVVGQRPQVIHVHMPNPAAFWLLTLRAAKRVPWVIHWHADVAPSQVDRRVQAAYTLYRPFEQALLKRAAAIIATSPPYLEASEPLQRWRNRCHVIPIGIKPSRLPCKSAAARTDMARRWRTDDMRLLSIGRLAFYKGHDVLLEALEPLDGVQTIIAGSGPRREHIDDAVAARQLQSKVSVVGYVSDQEAAALLASADAFVLPSIERSEAFGIVLLEAMIHGLPTIVSRIPGSGTGWVVEHESTGLLVPPHDPTSLADAIRRLRDDADLRRSLGKAAVTRFAERFDIKSVTDSIRSLYQRVV